MTNETESLNEARGLLQEWLNYFDGRGHSTGLKARTLALLERKDEPEKPRFGYVPLQHPDGRRFSFVLGIDPEIICPYFEDGFRKAEGVTLITHADALKWSSNVKTYLTLP